MGDKIKFWYDKWVGIDSLDVSFPRLFNLALNRNANVMEVGQISNGLWIWRNAWRREPFGRERNEERLLKESLVGGITFSTQPDQRVWSFDTANGYTVGKAYSMMAGQNNILEPRICTRLWNRLVPTKVSCFGWRLLLNGIPTKSGLLKRGVKLEEAETICCICRRDFEDENHLFVQCPKIQSLWMKCYNWWGISLPLPNSIPLLCEAHSFGIKKVVKSDVWFLIFLVVTWSIWYSRNSIIHNAQQWDEGKVARLVKQGTGKTTLAVGDDANDVGMIQETDIGVGIRGVEGMQAVMVSDFSLAQFRFLERLLVVHGHWCYKRIAQMICYFFDKNIAFGLTLFYFEAFTGFSGQSIYDDWYMILFNVLLTSFPVISLGVFQQHVPSDVCLQFSALYQQGPRNLFFDWYRIFGWMGNGFYSSLIIFFLNIIIFYDQALRMGGQTADMAALGTTMFTSIIWALNCQIALTMSHFTWIQHLLIWGSIVTWYLFLFMYGMLSPTFSGNAYQLLVEALASAPIYWPLSNSCLKDIEDKRMWTRERSKARQKTNIGFSARVDAKIRQLRVKLQRKQPSLEQVHDMMSPIS
ncbi:hypothetical protein SLEP1_g13493 [Rubroshorea leprosula]|uniref:P-type phospholipid transporter n=1 Tax=Rubroshorea leprosula TaxID=152421 RepID=A0AAV5IM69_9ROSI|nr:hypothetical protein SLEP1_g13493 [Rubroshorea leprosula]